MTVQEALKECIQNVDFETEELENIVISALEKQIPQTPNLEGDGYCPEGNLVYDTWICPNCEKDYEVDYDYYDYCPNCGQKIDKSVFDWEEGGTSD